MADKEYLSRIADDELALRLEAFGAVQIKGPNGVVRPLLRNNKPKVL